MNSNPAAPARRARATRPAARGRRRVSAAVLAAALTSVLTGLLAGVLSGAPASAAGTAVAGSNPLAGGPWGVYTGGADGVYPAWQAATGADRSLLAKVALRPRVRWFTSHIPASDIAAKVGDYIIQTQAGNPDVLVQMAMFRLFPQGEVNRDTPLSLGDQDAYRQWVDNAAGAIGDARVAMVLEPDLGVALKGWRPEVRLDLAAYAARVFGALPRTSVYLDASDGDWLKVPAAVDMLRAAGVQYVRGFALGATHYASTARQLRFGREVVAALTDAGIPGRHFVVDTADNGRPFTWLHYYAVHPDGRFDNAETCRTPTERHCITLGIPPTSRVAAAAWHLPQALRPVARGYVDAYLWFGRPWLDRQASPFDLARTLAVARTTPY